LIWEGLAAVASKVLVPCFSDEEYLFCHLPNCGDYKWLEENRELVLKKVVKLLGVRDFNVYREYFMGGNHPKDVLSPMSGYYAGYLIVKKIVEKLGFSKFIKLSPDE